MSGSSNPPIRERETCLQDQQKLQEVADQPERVAIVSKMGNAFSNMSETATGIMEIVFSGYSQRIVMLFAMVVAFAALGQRSTATVIS